MQSQGIDVSVDLMQHPWDGQYRDPADYPLNTHGHSAGITKMGLMPNGTTSGLSTVMMEVRLPDGTLVIAETTLRLFRAASAALLASPLAESEANS